jgi:hypothetical protein
VFHAQGYARLVDSERKLGEVPSSRAFSAEREGTAVRIEPGKEEDFRYIRGWLASSAWLDRLIAAAEPDTAASADPTGSPVLHMVGRALPTATRRLLQWRGRAVAAQVSRLQSNRR